MLSCSEEVAARAGAAKVVAREARVRDRHAPARVIATGETLFGKGERRGALYRVESGALCHYILWDDGRHDIIEFAFPGDIIGFGHLADHISTAQAVVETEVSLVDAQEFAEALEADGQLAARVAAADDREFAYLREKAVAAGRGKPLERVASLISALSRLGVPEGREATVVKDDICADIVAERLNMSAHGVARALAELERRGLIEASEAGLRVVDLDALERLAAA